jgi:hypothetical protein
MENAADIAQFVGRFHVLLLHLPIGVLLLLGFLELLSLRPHWRQATAANRFVLAWAAPVAVLTAVTGWLLAGGGGYEARLLFLHRWTGVAAAGTACVLWFLHRRGWLSVYRMFLFMAVCLTIVAGHLGGSLTHGRDYLTRHAPGWFGSAYGESDPAVDARGDYAAIQSVLTDYCVACHGPDKAKGGLRLDSFERVLEGGDSGPAVEPGDKDGSLLLTRMELSVTDDDHMPPEGKPQPTAPEVKRIADWISAGAPH